MPVMMLMIMVTKTPMKNSIERMDPSVVPPPSPPGVLPPASAIPMSTAAPSSASAYFCSRSSGRMRPMICLMRPALTWCLAPLPA